MDKITQSQQLHMPVKGWSAGESGNTQHVQPETIYSLIEKQAQAIPDQIAIIDGEMKIQYQQMMERASAIAGELMSRGIAPGSLVGVCMNRSWELIATLIGVLRAGCGYVPLDPAYPQDRVRYMLEHSRAAAAIVAHKNAAELCEGVSHLIRLDEISHRAESTVAGP